jgi:hypothetical protein
VRDVVAQPEQRLRDQRRVQLVADALGDVERRVAVERAQVSKRRMRAGNPFAR